jgi:hypothetical protein
MVYGLGISGSLSFWIEQLYYIGRRGKSQQHFMNDFHGAEKVSGSIVPQK